LAWIGLDRLGLVWMVFFGLDWIRSGFIWIDSDWFGSVWFGVVWFGLVRLGLVLLRLDGFI